MTKNRFNSKTKYKIWSVFDVYLKNKLMELESYSQPDRVRTTSSKLAVRGIPWIKILKKRN